MGISVAYSRGVMSDAAPLFNSETLKLDVVKSGACRFSGAFVIERWYDGADEHGVSSDVSRSDESKGATAFRGAGR